MSTTTAAMLLLSADRLARELHASTEPVSLTQWETFDNSVYRCLHALVGPGRRLTGHDSAAGSAAVRALQEYPTPLRPAPGEVYSPREAARLTGFTAYRVTLDAVADRIHAERVDRALQIPAEELDHRPALTPAVSTDRHPLSRLSVALGGMTDVLAGHRASGRASLTDDRHIAAAMRHVLSLTAVAARHTLSRVAIVEADRPLLIAQYAQRAVDALEGRSGYPQLWTMTSTNPPLTANNLNDRLEIGLRAWSAAAARHLQYHVPSTDLIRAWLRMRVAPEEMVTPRVRVALALTLSSACRQFTRSLSISPTSPGPELCGLKGKPRRVESRWAWTSENEGMASGHAGR